MRACFPGHWIEFGAGGVEPHELKASWCAGETWCVLLTRLMGETRGAEPGPDVGWAGEETKGRLHIATITRLRPNRMHSQLMHPQLLRLPLQRRWPGRRRSLPGFSGLGRKSHSSHEPVSQRAIVSARGWLRLRVCDKNKYPTYVRSTAGKLFNLVNNSVSQRNRQVLHIFITS
jgi:hypothetical protein